MPSLNGGWSYDWQGATSVEFAKDETNLLQAIEHEVGGSKVVFAEGCKYDEVVNLEDAMLKAADVDHIILCLGENSYTEFLGDINELDLPEAQIALARAMIKTGKPITLVLLEGRPRIISKIADEIGSILLGYYPGQAGANSISDIIFGKINPSGKLPYTYPRYSNALMTYDHKHVEAERLQGSEIPFYPQFEFGHGLSYTQFEYGNILLEKKELTESDDLRFSFSVKNTGNRAGKEVAQIYVADDYASITPSVKRLRAFRKVELEAGETKQLDFIIPMKQLSFVNAQNEWVLEEGTFKLMVGNLMAEFELKNG
jgi:beta-glucosidase